MQGPPFSPSRVFLRSVARDEFKRNRQLQLRKNVRVLHGSLLIDVCPSQDVTSSFEIQFQGQNTEEDLPNTTLKRLYKCRLR